MFLTWFTYILTWPLEIKRDRVKELGYYSKEWVSYFLSI